MTTVHRVLDLEPVPDLAAYERAGGGQGLARARADRGEVFILLAASGLRGRGGAGFPTAKKWLTIKERLETDEPVTVVVNAAEGEPGTFKDRAILTANPYRVLEGALIAALAIGADDVKVALKANAVDEQRVRAAVAEVNASDWLPGTTIEVVAGPASYLYGEETALLEVIDGRHPFPRVAPPWQRGLDEDRLDPDAPVSPALVNNVETFANVALIVANGPDWFRSVGTERSPGTIVCTVSGRTTNSGVIEVAMGTTLRNVLGLLHAEPIDGEITAVMSGVSNRLIRPIDLDVPLTYEDVAAIGSGLGTGGFIVLDESVDPVAVAQGVSWFLAVESCGQCTHCKEDGLVVAAALQRLRDGTSDDGQADLELIGSSLTTIVIGARCFLATQHQQMIDSFVACFPAAFGGHAAGLLPPAAPFHVAPIMEVMVGEPGVRVRLDDSQATKQPDWTHNAEDSGKTPAERMTT
ncbi:MAG: NADH-ubiquinone oxidoreductase-F iron-sulfur binding region domain-containing protein [Aquihabitans sp.]